MSAGPSRHPFARLTLFLSLAAAMVACLSPVRGAESAPALLGSPAFRPTPEHPVGWRGDGSGRYPGAEGPLAWQRVAAGAGQTADAYTTKGILWMAPLPNIGVSSPIIVGDQIFVTTEVCDLVCLDKATGRIRWIRSSAEFEGLNPAERAANPAYEKLASLTADLAKANDEVVEVLNARLATALVAPMPKLDPALKKKRDLEKQIQTAQQQIDKKGFERYWGQGVFGFSGPTPTSDGQHVCVFYTTGLAACYGLDGQRQWIVRGKGGGSEHGNFASPLLIQNKLVVWANEMRAYDVATGKLAWSQPAKAFNSYGSLFRVQAGGEPVACFQWGFFHRASDGQPVWEQGVFGDSVTTPIVEGDTIYVRTGYPKYNEHSQGLHAFKIPPNTEPAKLEPAFAFAEEWAPDEIPVDKEKSPFDRGFVASPLYVDGLIYQVTQGGGLLVNEAATGALVYKKVLPLKPRTHYWDWAGCAASPAFAGGKIYVMDNQGTTLVLAPGREFKLLATNHLAETRENGKEQTQDVSSPVFEGARMYYRTPGYLYCIGSK